MKLKGVNPLELHIEKIVLGVMLVLFLAVISMQFVSRPNDVNVGNRKVSPSQIYTSLEGQATQLQSQLSDRNPELPQLAHVDLVERYNDAFANSGGLLRLSSSLGQGVDITSGIEIPDRTIGGGEGPVAGLQVPMTTRPVAASLWSTLDPYAVGVVPEYGQFIPSAQPFDFASVSIEATFNGKDLEAVLLGKNDSGTAIPRRFWSATGMAILGFEAERQKLMDDGSWGEVQPIVTPPHTPIPMRAIDDDAGLLELTELVKTAASVENEVARPMFPPTIAGMAWAPPSDSIDSGDETEASKIAKLQRRLGLAIMELDRLQNGRPAQQTNPGPGGKTGRDPGRDPGNTQNPGFKPNPRLIKRAEKKIKDLKEQLKDLGVEVEDTIRGRLGRGADVEAKPILEQEAVALWAHDLGVEPGATYRYRTRVVLNNPLFRKSSELDPDDADQQALTKNPLSRGEWSKWSDSVVVGAEEYFFVTGGTNGTQANIELYKIFYGQYRKSSLKVAPGDELAATIRMSGDLLMFDSSVVDVQEAAKAVEALSEKDSELPDGITELSSRIKIDLGVFLLDVYTGQGSSVVQFGRQAIPMQAVLRGKDGSLLVRSDLGDEASLAYAFVSKSASSHELRAPGAPAKSPAAELFEPKEP